MKTIAKLFLFLCGIVISFNTYSQVKVLSSGNVGINQSSPLYKLDVQGTVRIKDWTDIIINTSGDCCGSPVIYPSTSYYLQLGKQLNRIGQLWVNTIHYWDGVYKVSDAKVKDNIKNVSGIRKSLNRINIVSFTYNTSQFLNLPEKQRNHMASVQIGFIAQDVEKVYPNLVITDDSTGIKSVDYNGFIPLVVQALKEQDSIINVQATQIKELQKKVNNSSKSKISQTTTTDNSSNFQEATLDQNFPNPFNQSTQIGYYLPETTIHAMLNIYNMNGNQIKSFPVKQNGKGYITINGSELQPGIYIYSMIADGKEVDSKRMILTQ